MTLHQKIASLNFLYKTAMTDTQKLLLFGVLPLAIGAGGYMYGHHQAQQAFDRYKKMVEAGEMTPEQYAIETHPDRFKSDWDIKFTAKV